MTEDAAREWLTTKLSVPRETLRTIESFVELLLDANHAQNLIGASTIPNFWERHIVDCAQLLLHAPADSGGRWVDIGSGAGLPGLLIAILGTRHVTLVENRPLRAAFLREAVAALALTNVDVLGASIRSVRLPAVSVLSARAVAPLERLFEAAVHLADAGTVWLLPKGRQAASELAAARDSWQGAFAMQPSVTDPEAAIIVAKNVARRTRR